MQTIGRTGWLALVAAPLLVGCGSDPTESTLQGTLDAASFTATVSVITAENDEGVRTTAPVEADGGFSLVLAKGAGYRFFLGDDGRSIPLVLRNNNGGRLETGVEIDTGGATVSMGSVRFWPGVPAQPTSFERMSVLGSGSVDTKAACTAGVFEGSSMPCASGAAPVACEDVDDDDDEECEDGVDPNGDECDGGPAANQTGANEIGTANQAGKDASPYDALGVVELNVPREIACDDDDDEEEDDD